MILLDWAQIEHQYEMMYQHALELEEREEAKIVEARLDRLEKHPDTAIPWRSVRRTGLPNE